MKNYKNSIPYYITHLADLLKDGSKKFKNEMLKYLLDEFERYGLLDDLKMVMKDRIK